VRKAPGFTLIEIVISVFILMLLVMLAVPSVTGVLADRRLRQSFDNFNRLVYQAQERAMTEHRPYLLVWTEKNIVLRPEAVPKNGDSAPLSEPRRRKDNDNDSTAVSQLHLNKGESFTLKLTAALRKDPPPEWIFWPTGTCEPADVKFAGRDGTWTASYSPLTARAQLTFYVAR
jgi:type II secretory pathway pseudopilin PulG